MIIRKNVLHETPWITLIEKEVENLHDQKHWTHYSVTQSDYVTVFARTPSGKIPVVRQYRPAVEAFTYEFPSGLLEVGETPEQCVPRELEEECGVKMLSLSSLGKFFPDSGRFNNHIHNFYAKVSEKDPNAAVEAGIEVFFWTDAELKAKIRSGEFSHQLHSATYYLALELESGR